MEPQSDISQGLHLPQPSASKGPSMGYQEIAGSVPVPSATGFNSGQQTAAPLAMQTQDFTSASGGMPQSRAARAGDQADDLDKEWVAKAKLIVEQTKNDPYTQSKEIAKVKADYLRIRYNKHIKVGQDKAL